MATTIRNRVQKLLNTAAPFSATSSEGTGRSWTALVLEPHSYDDMLCTVCGFYGDETQDSLVLSDYVQMDHPAILSAVEVARGNRIVLESDGYSPLSR